MTRVSACCAILALVSHLFAFLPATGAAEDRRLQRPQRDGRRLALVIGNDRYDRAPLVNAVNDARDVAGALEAVGFNVSLLTDATLEAMDRGVEAFVSRIDPGDVALMYYSGHGVQVGGENYLIPVDFRGSDEVALRRRTTSVSEVQEQLERRGARVRILVLDACRDNPFRGTRSGARGLAQYGAEGALIAYATGPGSTASDNSGKANGLFTSHFLDALRTPGVSATELFRTVRERVREASGGRQVPWLSDALIGTFVFVAHPPDVPGSTGAPPVTGSSAADLKLREELLFWESIQNSRSAPVFEEYLRRYGDSGRFTLVARERLDELRRPANTSTPPAGNAGGSTSAPPAPPPPASSDSGRPLGRRPPEPQVGQPGKDVIWVPTPSSLVSRILDLARVTREDYLVDLGSGDGRMVIEAARRGTRAHGIEYNPQLVELSKYKAAEAGVSQNATFAAEDIFRTNFSNATVVTMFLLPSINLKLRPTLLAMRPGTRVLSTSFTMEDWEADETVTVEQGCASWCTALLWIVPAKVEGEWKMGNGVLRLQQQFQFLSGTLNGIPLSGRLRGSEITFAAGGTTYTGRVDATSMQGRSSGSSSWTATRR